jgi:hypothetical protein
VLDQTMAMAESTGIVVSVGAGTYPGFDGHLWLVLHGSAATPNRAPDCAKALSLLNKSNFAGKKMASEPGVQPRRPAAGRGAELHRWRRQDGGGDHRHQQAVLLLGKYHFDGNGYTGKISAVDAATMNQLARILDDYYYYNR